MVTTLPDHCAVLPYPDGCVKYRILIWIQYCRNDPDPIIWLLTGLTIVLPIQVGVFQVQGPELDPVI